MLNHDAIYRAYPNAIRIGDIAGAFDADGNQIELDQTADALYWSNQGDNTKLDEYYQACAAVKAKYPKP
jgi:hypothetical protein